jgi:hypothetical protein
MRAIVKAALAVSKSYPVFPTTSKKMPCWSNRELGCAKGEGGFKIATQDRDEVVRLFSHRNAETVSVPMGPMSGLLAIDPDLYKGQHVVDWHAENLHWLKKTLCHETKNGGRHYFFEWTDKVRFPATLAAGVDVKGHGGYVVFPPSGGYTVLRKLKVKPFPLDVLQAAMIAKGGTGNVIQMDSYNQATDDDLIASIQKATELYPALRSLAYRMPGRRQDDGTYLTEDEMITILENLMDTSIAADAGHDRHDNWIDRRSKIPELVTTAMEKEKQGVGLTDAEISAIGQGESFIQAQETIAASSRPIGPQQEVSLEQIEALVGELGGPVKTVRKKDKEARATVDINSVVRLNAKQLRSVTLPPIKYIIPRMMSIGGTCSLAGMSNVGKTRFMAALIMALAVGDTKRMGLPQCTGKASSLYIANEEHIEDMARRFAAVCYQHDDKDSADIFVRGKKAGTFRLVAINETGHPEVDAKNVAWLVKEIRETGVKVLVMDPYVTLAEGGDENSSSTASMLTKAMLLIIAATDVCIFYPHHTPKGDRKADRDWPRGDSGAWRGSGAIYSSLDFGFTLANWYPGNPDQRKAWKAQHLTAKLSRFIALDTGKIREGEALDPVMYELVGQDMDEGEGDPIGVCRLTDEATAMNALLEGSIDIITNDELSYAMVNTLGVGTHKNMAECDRLMHGHQAWPNTNKVEGKQKLLEMFGEKYNVENGSVHVLCDAKGKWRIVIEEKD